ncbi:HPP family protein, partial [Acinetobacter calcoaceticus]
IHYQWSFLVFPVLVGAVALGLVAMLINNIKASTKWPMDGLGILNSKK